MTDGSAILRPGEFSRRLLQAVEASEGRRQRRKRDQTPDRIGLELKRELLEQVAAEDPEPDAFEGWLLGKALSAPASGPVLAAGNLIMDEYRLARIDPGFGRWLEEGAPSDDAGPGQPKSDAEVDPRARALEREEHR